MPITHALPARARRLAALGACALAAAAACSAPPPAHEAIQATLGELPSPAGPDAALPQLAVTPDGRVLTSWLEKSADGRRFRFAALEEDGWTAPVTIAEGDRFFANWADVPSIVALADGTLAAHWLEKSGPDTYAYDVRVRLSRDGGATWSPAVSPHTDGTPTEHGFVSMYDDPAGGLGLVWLDGRAMAGHAGGMDAMQAEMSLRATAFDGDAPRPETLVDGRVCECCPTTAVAVAGGIAIAYRDRAPDEVRNIAVARLADGRWSEPAHVHDDGWMIPGCPVNGPALASDGASRVALAWFTAPDDRPRVNVAFSADGARSFGDPITVDDGAPIGRVDAVLLPEGGALVSWIEQTPGGAELRVRHVAPGGARGPSARISEVNATRSSGYPRMVRAGGALVFAWTDAGDRTSVRVARAHLEGTP